MYFSVKPVFFGLFCLLYFGPVESQQCTCVHYYYCEANLTSFKEGASNFHENLTIVEGRKWPTCVDPTDVCCSNGTILNETAEQIEEVVTGCRFYTQTNANFSVNSDSRSDEFTWMVALLLVDNSNRTSNIGGGSLIDGRTVLTAAANVHNIPVGNLRARVGSYNLFGQYDLSYDFRVESVQLHPRFKPQSRFFNFATLRLSEPVIMKVSPICLVTDPLEYNPEDCIEIGWGNLSSTINKNGGGLLKKSKMHVVDLRTCGFLHNQKNTGNTLPEGVLCAADNTQLMDPCTGDFGSPLICQLRNSTNDYVQVGLASIAMCGVSGRPGIFADTSQAMSWINGNLNKDVMPIAPIAELM